MGSPSFSPSLKTVNRTNTKSNKSAAHSNVSRRLSCQTGLNPLFFTELVRAVMARVAPEPFEPDEADGDDEPEDDDDDEEEKCVQSGVYIETST